MDGPIILLLEAGHGVAKVPPRERLVALPPVAKVPP